VPEDARAEVEKLIPQAVKGKASYVLAVNNERLPAAYIALPPGAVQASHVGPSFSKNPDYAGQNTRAYDTDEAEQNKVRAGALPGALNEDILTSTDPSSANAAPQVAIVISAGPDGKPRARWQAAGGNAREMMTQQSSLEDQERISEAWQEKSGHFGLENLPAGHFGYRYLGVYDTRTEAGARSYQRLVDNLNPSTGVVQDTSDRADLDAVTKIPIERLANVSVTLSAKEAKPVFIGLIRDAEKLGLDRNRMASMVKSPLQIQLYIQRLVLAAAFRNPAVANLYTDNLIGNQNAAFTSLIADSAKAAIALRVQGSPATADALGQMLANVGSYLSEGTTLQIAVGRAAEQIEAIGDYQTSQSIAQRLTELTVTITTKAGKKKLSSQETSENWGEYLSFLTHGISNHNETDMFGEAKTLPEVVRDITALHRNRDAKTDSPNTPIPARSKYNRATRLRELEAKRQREGLSRWENEELTQLEKLQGQSFMEFSSKPATTDLRWSRKAPHRKSPTHSGNRANSNLRTAHCRCR